MNDNLIEELKNLEWDLNHARNKFGCDYDNYCWDDCCEAARDLEEECIERLVQMIPRVLQELKKTADIASTLFS